MARLDRDTRRALANIDSRVWFADGAWHEQLTSPTAAEIDRAVLRLAHACEVLAGTRGAADALWERASADPIPEVARRAGLALLALEDLRADHLAWLVYHPHPQVAARAALRKGAAGPRLLELLAGGPDERREAAIALTHLPRDERGDEIERILLALLDTDPDPVDVVDALGRFGTRDAIPHLEATGARGLGRGALAERAHQAVEAIRARVAPAEGRLSLADDAGGALSEAQAHPSGRVSVARGTEQR